MRPVPAIDVRHQSHPLSASEHSEAADRLAAVARTYGISIQTFDRVSGGLSGAEVFRVDGNQGRRYAFRRWPQSTHLGRVVALHRTLRTLRSTGCSQIAELACLIHADAEGMLAAGAPATVLQPARSPDGRLWHVENWQPGQALLPSQVGRAHAAKVGRLLATLHISAGQIDDPHPLFHRRCDIPPLLTERLEFVDHFRKVLAGPTRPVDHPLARAVLDCVRRRLPDLRSELATEIARGPTPLQVCLRDLKEDSVLWQDDAVTGLIDLSAARTDHPAGDIARLFGGLFTTDRDLWRVAFEAYETVRPLSPADHRLVRLAVASEVVLSAIGWIDKLWWKPRATLPSQLELIRFQTYAHRLLNQTQDIASAL